MYKRQAQGLYNLCTPVSTAQVKPGDLVFFKGTYDTPGVSHCGCLLYTSQRPSIRKVLAAAKQKVAQQPKRAKEKIKQRGLER